MSPADAKQPAPLPATHYESTLSSPPVPGEPAVPTKPGPDKPGPDKPGPDKPGTDKPREAVETPPITDAHWADNPGPLGDKYQSGVYDPHNALTGKPGAVAKKERTTADKLAQDSSPGANDGAAVHFRSENSPPGQPNPDAMVRYGPDDPGRITELKTLESPTQNAVQANIREARHSLRRDGGDAVIDGQTAGLTRDTADAGYDEANRKASAVKPMPGQVRFILNDGSQYTRSADTRGADTRGAES
jgi:hypothetical protein